MEQSGMGEIIEAPKEYSLPREEFKQGRLSSVLLGKKEILPIVDYVWGEKVTRQNFVPMIVDSFAKSRGIRGAQKTFLEWLKTHTGFDYVSSIDNYLKAGGLRCLSDQERGLIQDSFGKVHKHRNILSVNFSFDGELRMTNDKLIPTFFSNEDLKKMSFDKLAESIAPKIDEVRARPRLFDPGF